MSEGLLLSPAISASSVPTPPSPLYTLFYNADDSAIPTLKAHTTGALIPLGGLSTEAAQDIVGAMATDSSTIDFTYDDTAGTLTAIVKTGSIGVSHLSFDPATQAELDAVAANLAAHIALGTGAHAASAISNTPAGNISSTNVQAALNELDTEKIAAPAGTVTDENPVVFDTTTGKLVKQKTYAAFKTLLALVKGDVGLGSVDNVQQLPMSYLDTDTALAANSDTKVASQKAVKAYADALIAANDAMVFKGVIDASSNPNYPAADRGHTYKISVAGKIGGASGINVEVGDLIMCITDGTAAGTQAAVGANWNITQVNIDGAVTGAASSTDNNLAFWNGASGKIIKDSGVALDTNTGLTANSDSKIASQKAVKAYVDALSAAVAAGYQPLDSDLTAIALLATTTYGRSLLTLADAAALTAQLNVATTSLQGALSAADKTTINNYRKGWVNILDYGADPTGATSSATALTNAQAALPNGGVILFPTGTYQFGNVNYNLNTAHITLLGAARYNVNFITSSTTEDIITRNQYYQTIENITFVGTGTGQNPTRTAGYAVNCNAANSAYGVVRRCSFTYQFNCINVGDTLTNVDDVECRYFKNSGIPVTQNSDHHIQNAVMDNNTSFLPTTAGIDVQVTASLVLNNNNIIHSNFALNLSPTTGVTVPSVKGVNNFFDTSAVGLNMTGAGSVLRCEFTNSWFSSMSSKGIALTPAVGGQVDGVTFVNCDIYNNVGGTTTGIDTNAQTKKWKMLGCSIAGWTTGINLVAGTNHFPTILCNTIGAVSAFGVNTTGVVIGAGAYAGMVIAENDVVNNTTPYTLGAVTINTNYANFRIIDNAGINPVAVVTTPAVAASTVAMTNTTGVRILVRLSGGTVTAYTVNGVATGLVAAATLLFPLEPGSTLAITYSVVPTMKWIGQ